METPSTQDHADVRILPPLVFVGAIVLGVLLQLVVSVRLEVDGGMLVAIGLPLIALGVAALAWSMVWMRRTHQDPDPRKPSPELIAGGPYRFSRNPIYVGMALIQAGIGIAIGNLWIVLLVFPALAFLRRAVIEKEEAYLERKFGDSYDRYRASVRRWL